MKSKFFNFLFEQFHKRCLRNAWGIVKKVILFLLCLVLLWSMPAHAFAEGDPNIDGGGDTMGQGTTDNKWTAGRDGVRVTIIRVSDNTVVSAPIDFTNQVPTDIGMHFGKVSKVQYRDGRNLHPSAGVYTCITPSQTMPRIVSSGGSNNIATIRDYFCRTGTIQDIADKTGFSYEALISGAYKILLEPMAYFTYNGVVYAMTAHEAALYDQVMGGDLKKKMVSLTHKNLPLAMYLEVSDLGFPAWNGSATSSVSDEVIITYLGLGIVRFSDVSPVSDEIPMGDEIYRCDTEVITSVVVSSGAERTPANPAYVNFYINGQKYTHSDIYLPEDGSQLAWVRWRTPSTPGAVTIRIESNCTISRKEIVAQVTELSERIPPNPQANDRYDGFQGPSLPNESSVSSLTWGEWSCWWKPDWVWVSDWEWCDHGEEGGHWIDRGEWEDQGEWVHQWNSYTATLYATAKVKPDEKSPTASATQLRSGYGINMNVSAELQSNAPSGQLVGAQNVIAYFPEFKYQSYWRLLTCNRVGVASYFEFKTNPYSTYGRKVHFLPVWYPDGNYTVCGKVIDAYTPAGMLRVNVADSVGVRGNVFDDWVRPYSFTYMRETWDR